MELHEEDVFDRLNDLSGGKAPDKYIDAVGLESHATASFDAIYDRAKQALIHKIRRFASGRRPDGNVEPRWF